MWAAKNGLDGEFSYAHYNASKGGVIMLTKTMALELAHLGIRVNGVFSWLYPNTYVDGS
jgi:3-oxoacyl-[acyl-carrier protein] reductase